MMCYVYAFYNKKVSAYEKPVVNNFDKDTMHQLVIRDVLVSDNEAKSRMAECSLYYLGQYNDEQGLLIPESKPEFIFDIAPLIEGVKEGEVHA